MRRATTIQRRVGSLVTVGVLVVMLLIAALPLQPTSAQGPGAGGDSKEGEVALPEALGEPRSVRVAAALGAVSDSIHIDVPPGRRNVEPQLVLAYSSMAGLGSAGLGWEIETGRVERWRGDGTPPAPGYAENVFSYSIGGAGGELHDTGGGVYRARLESLYREFRQVGGGWEMYNGEGVLHRFGGTPESRIDGQMWLLDLVQDRSGNTVTYAYLWTNGAAYLEEVRYTGYAPTGEPGANRISFEYEERPDVRVSYGYGVREERTLRLRRISAFAGTQLARRYELTYEPSPVNGQSLLKLVTLVGADGVSPITLRTLEYRTRPLGWGAGAAVGGFPVPLAVPCSESDGWCESGARVLDVNGDGYADWVGNGQGVWLGDGKGGFARDANDLWNTSLASAGIEFVEPGGDRQGADKGVRMVDVNADARPDLFIASPFWGGRAEVWLNTGRRWSRDAGWSASLAALSTIPCGFGSPGYDPDLSQCSLPYCDEYPTLPPDACTPPPCERDPDNPDCTPPICQGTEDDPDPCTPPICTIDPKYAQEVIEPFALVEEDYDSKGVQLVDVNGDGRLDILWSMSREQLFWWGRDPVFVRAVFLNTGSGWAKDDVLTAQIRTIPDFVRDSQMQGYSVLDVNGDGLVDIVRTFAGAQKVLLRTGSGWLEDPSYTSSIVANNIVSLAEVDGERRGQGLMPLDFDDDGLVDYLRANETVTQAFRNTGMGWEPAPQMVAMLASMGIAFSASDGDVTGVTIADVDGDGLSDVLQAKGGMQITDAPSESPLGPDVVQVYLPVVGKEWGGGHDQAASPEHELWLSNSLRSGLLVKSTGPLGEVTELDWASSTAYDNRRADGVHGLPCATQVITRLTRYDGRGNAYPTTYDYKGGLLENRQTRGFAQSQQILPSGAKVKTWYHQEEGLSSQLKVEEAYDTEGRVRMRRSALYEVVPATAPVQQFWLLQSDTETIDPDGSLHTRVVNAHDERLNYVSVLRDPDVRVDGDETTTTFTWARNDEAGIWNLPARTTVVQGQEGRILSEFIMLYDDLPEGEALLGLASERRSLIYAREPGEQAKYASKRMSYDEYGNVVSTTDGEGNVTTYAYDEVAATFRTRAVDPEGRVLESTYDPRFGTVLSDTDAGGNITYREYDAFGRPTKVTMPGDEGSPFGTRTYEYSDLGDAGAQWFRTKETETPGEAGTFDTTKYFDGLGRVYRVEREGAGGIPVIVHTEYDDADNPVRTSRPHFQGDPTVWTEIKRDELHRPVRVVEPHGTALTLEYAGPRVDLLDVRGSRTSFYRNAEGKTTAIHQWVDGVEQVTRYTYDPLGRLISIVDPLGERTEIGYDALGRRVYLVDPNAGTFKYRYNLEDLLVEQRGPDGQRTHFSYNRAGDLLQKAFPDGTVDEYTYDAAGNMVRIDDSAGAVRITYDARGNVVERRRTVLGRTYITRYTYDSLRRIRSITYPDGFVVNREYDAGGNLARLTDREGREIADAAYNAAGQITEQGFGNDVHATNAYDALLRLTSIRTLTGKGEMLQGLDYAYDAASDILSITDSVYGASQAFEYDELGRLTRAVGAYGEELYKYDAIGNLLRKGSLFFAVDPKHPQRAVCGVDLASNPGKALGIGNNPHANPCDDAPQADNQQPDENENGTGGPESNPNIARSFRMVYDERGNMVEKGGTHYEYDDENHLVRVRDAKGKVLVENVYDAGGQRVIQRTPQGITVYIDGIYEETKSHASRHVKADSVLVATVVTPRATVKLLGAAGGQTRAGLTGFALTLGLASVGLSTRRRYAGQAITGQTWPQHVGRAAVLLLLVGAILCAGTPAGLIVRASSTQPKSEKRYYYHLNHLGSTNVVTDDRGKVVEQREYKPYGDPFAWTGPNSGPRELLLTFAGQRYDDASGLYYFGARHYDPEIGRFLTADTQVPDPMNPKDLHRYAYAGGNPIRNVDPTGHGFFDWLIGIIVVIFVVVLAVFLAVISFGALSAVSGMLAFFVGMVFLGAGLGAGAMGIYALARGTSVFSSDFWMALAAGAVVGAAVGAAIGALPASIGFTGSLGPWAAFFVGLAADVLVGAVLGGLGPVVAHLAQGGGPEDILSEELGLIIATAAIKGAIFGLITGGLLNRMAMEWELAGAILAGLLSVALTAEGGWEVTKSGYDPSDGFSFLNMFGTDANWFRSSPSKRLGIPSWAFAGTWVYSGGSERSPVLATMPFVP